MIVCVVKEERMGVVHVCKCVCVMMVCVDESVQTTPLNPPPTTAIRHRPRPGRGRTRPAGGRPRLGAVAAGAAGVIGGK